MTVQSKAMAGISMKLAEDAISQAQVSRLVLRRRWIMLLAAGENVVDLMDVTARLNPENGNPALDSIGSKTDIAGRNRPL
jgi:hypothetical protein